MKKVFIAAALLAAAGMGIVTCAQDVVKVAPESFKVEFENDQARILRMKLGPFSKVPMHSHPDIVVVRLTDAHQKTTTPEGASTELRRKAGEVVFREALTHTEENLSDQSIEVVLLELKAATRLASIDTRNGASDQDVVKVAPENYKVELENDQVRIIRVKRGPRSRVPMHSHPNNVIILVTNSDQKITTPDGKTTEAHFKAGEVAYRGAVTHVEESLSDQPQEVVLVELKTPGMK